MDAAPWVTLVGGVIAYETWALRNNPDLLLSRCMDRLRARHTAYNVAAHLIIGTTALHLVRGYPKRYAHLDPYSRCSPLSPEAA